MPGERLVKNMVSNLLFIGTANASAPIYHRNKPKNFIPIKVHASEYHRTYPYRATQ
jgi:peptide/nickel transport system substrate-binding protein